MEKLEKPVKPIEPLAKDFDLTIRSTATYDAPYVTALKKYHKDLKKYEEDMKSYEQTKFIMDVKRSDIKLCLKKYHVIKK